MADIITFARQVIAQEVKGLNALQASLGDSFQSAVNLLHGLKGRVIVSGMGKSGHIARKIAATMASTGTPAYFVHPAEASHGDLGMITKSDALLALSNSGETQELSDMLTYAKRFSIPVIAMVGRAPSSLADAADYVLQLPKVDEASPTQAPTTSTTMMLALGDAIAISLLELRGFTRDEFAVFHPGGKLGKALLRVRDLMHSGTQLPIVRHTENMQAVLLAITAKSFGCAGVIDDMDRLIGIITDGDLRRHMGNNILQQTAERVMTGSPKSIRPQALATEALAIMNEKSITSLFVVEDGRPVGILHIHDCLRAGIV